MGGVQSTVAWAGPLPAYANSCAKWPRGPRINAAAVRDRQEAPSPPPPRPGRPRCPQRAGNETCRVTFLTVRDRQKPQIAGYWRSLWQRLAILNIDRTSHRQYWRSLACFSGPASPAWHEASSSRTLISPVEVPAGSMNRRPPAVDFRFDGVIFHTFRRAVKSAPQPVLKVKVSVKQKNDPPY